MPITDQPWPDSPPAQAFGLRDVTDLRRGLCKGNECRRPLETDEEAERSYCDACWASVWCFQPNSDIDEWHFVADDVHDLQPGDAVSGDQCGSCGGNGWTFEHNAKGRPVVRCGRDEIYDRDGDEDEGPSSWIGCHGERPLRLMHTYEVIF